MISQFLNFKNPGVSVGGVLGKNPTHESFALCDIMKMWCKAIEVFEAGFQTFRHILQTAYRRGPKLVSKDA